MGDARVEAEMGGQGAAADTADGGTGAESGETRQRPAPERRRLVLAGVGAAVVVAVAVVATVLLTGGSGSDDPEEVVEVRAIGRRIHVPMFALGDAEELVAAGLEDVRSRGIEANGGELSCWYSLPEAGADANTYLRCGPVAFADSAPDTYWISVPVTFAPGGDIAFATSQPSALRQTSALEPGEVLVRPTGETPPAADEIDLERPAVASAEPGAAGVLDGDGVMVDLREPDEGPIDGAGHSSRLVGWGLADRALLADVGGELAVLAAAEGESWLILELAADRDPTAVDRIDYAVVAADGERTSLGDLSPQWADGTSSEQLFAVSVPADGEVTLVVDDGDTEQGWSLPLG